MEGLAVMGFVFGKLIKTLKEKGILEKNYKEE